MGKTEEGHTLSPLVRRSKLSEIKNASAYLGRGYVGNVVRKRKTSSTRRRRGLE